MTLQVPWFPNSLHKYAADAAELRAGWSYVVLEEVVDGTALLLRWPWPMADRNGRLHWPRGDAREVLEASVAVATLDKQLYKPNRLRREPRVGDTFAARVSDRAAWGQEEPVDDVREIFPDNAVDVSADARAAAKLAYQGSLVPAVSKREVEPELVRQATAERRRLRAPELLVEQDGAPTPPEANGAGR